MLTFKEILKLSPDLQHAYKTFARHTKGKYKNWSSKVPYLIDSTICNYVGVWVDKPELKSKEVYNIVFAEFEKTLQ